MGREKFDRLMPEFFRALGKLYEQNPAFPWDYLFFTVRDLLYTVGYFRRLSKYEDFKYGLDELVVPLLEEFINNTENPKALKELMIELSRVRNYYKQELEFRESDAYKLP